MLDSNYHTHSHFCDGSGSLEEYVIRAIDNKMRCIGFSSHAPLPYSNTLMQRNDLDKYIQEIKFLQKKYVEKIKILLGLEIDYIPNIMHPKDYELDFKIGSVHYIDFFDNGDIFGIDKTEEIFLKGLKEIFDNDMQKLCTRYFELVRDMLVLGNVDIVGHFDKIKKYHNFPETENWYKNEIINTLEVIKKSNAIIEINTRGLYKEKIPCLYPSEWVVKLVKEMGIPVVVNSDAHSVAELTNNFDYAEKMLTDLGFIRGDRDHVIGMNIFV